MRTDGVQMAEEALVACRKAIGVSYGDRYLPETPRRYSSKAKNAQEAHEAIRPTDPMRRPDSLRLESDMARLYELIWKRAIASQMAGAVLERTTIDMQDSAGAAGLRAVGTVVLFDGFLTLYDESRDDPDGDEEGGRLPQLKVGQAVRVREVTPSQHFTEPPPRYSEASLVKKMEELGIGRPSTYASILSVLQERSYVRLEKNRFHPEDKGRLVTAFLENFFARYVEYDFTAGLEEKLDDVSAGALEWKALLQRDRRDRRGAQPAPLPRESRWRRSACLPVLLHRPAEPEDRQVRRLHRLLQLSGLPLYPPARRSGRRRRGRRAQP
jgi:DNA topoisomerase-1